MTATPHPAGIVERRTSVSAALSACLPAHAVLTAEPYIQGEEFVMYLGDNLILGGLTELVAAFLQKKPNSQILLAKVPNPSQFGVAELAGDRVVHLVEKPARPPSDLALVGVYMFDHKIFEAARSIRPAPAASWRSPTPSSG